MIKVSVPGATMRLPRFLLHSMLSWAARKNMRVFRLDDMLRWAEQSGGRSFHTHVMLEWAGRQESKHNFDRALFGYRQAFGHGYGDVHVQVTASERIHRVLQELARHDPATVKWELPRARVAVAEALLERARWLRRRGELAEAKRDLQALIDRRMVSVSAKAAHEFAEMIDDARGNPRENRFPPEPKPSGPLLGRDPVLVSRLPDEIHRSDPHKDLPALGYTTESDALTDAIELCRTAIRLGTEVRRKGTSALLAQLLDDYGDPAGAAAARAHLDIPDKLRAADDEDLCEFYGTTDIEMARGLAFRSGDRDSDLSLPDSTGLAPFLVARLHPTEIVEYVRHSALRQPWAPDRKGCLTLTNERLLFLEPNLDNHELLAIDRTSIISIRPIQHDERGRTWLEIRFPSSAAEGTAAQDGKASVRVGQIPDVWLTTLVSSS